MYNFKQVVAKGPGSSTHDVATVSIGKHGVYFNRLAFEMITKTGNNFTSVMVSTDEEAKIIAFHFNKSSNKVRGNYAIIKSTNQAGGFSVGLKVSTKLPVLQKFLQAKYPNTEVPAFALKPFKVVENDFYIVDLKEEISREKK